ncbi:hypothetical protein [Clostridium sp. KNHs214]|uniref:hypothetical protein n=1 Tax=Clostridium sp. KNHs214 TaxID=1540257 RepID=UPI00054E56BE|nr:hypothetical protein [Clostridium sp. KNHs214]
MTNLERLKMSIEGINIEDNKLLIYLEENSLISTDNYNPQSNTNKKQILKTSLSILEDIANNPQTMKNYKTDDTTISNFAENLQNRIDQLEKKIRQIPDDMFNDNGSSFFYLFTN